MNLRLKRLRELAAVFFQSVRQEGSAPRCTGRQAFSSAA